ncbi:hypothetical protein [Caballeronia mineralivorans]|jgi:hypothetical protein|uniref:hypothetical protein n=1 Tax=Caballeronia mineralivorans TaxID=2010198 RepID=UPI0023EF7C7D|nr:hypothetical protein [Caballeronia mineralivorans]
MKLLTKLIACFLIAWLPILGYPAQASLCSAMAPAVSPSHESQMSMTDMGDHADRTKAPVVKTQAGGHCSMGSHSCSMPWVLVPSLHVTVAITSLPVYRPMSHVLIAQFIPEPPQRPPQAL